MMLKYAHRQASTYSLILTDTKYIICTHTDAQARMYASVCIRKQVCFFGGVFVVVLFCFWCSYANNTQQDRKPNPETILHFVIKGHTTWYLLENNFIHGDVFCSRFCKLCMVMVMIFWLSVHKVMWVSSDSTLVIIPSWLLSQIMDLFYIKIWKVMHCMSMVNNILPNLGTPAG